MIGHLIELLFNAEYYKKHKPRIDWEQVSISLIALAVIAVMVFVVLKGMGKI